jgi:diguanylate cyclase (GGDEF)-like protein
LEQSNILFKDAAYTDILTNSFNRRYGMKVLDDWLAEGRSFVLCFVDIDNLKCVNDRFGHSEGDNYIIQVAEILRSFSSESILCRIGGDEFMILAQGLDNDKAIKRMETLRNSQITYNFPEDRSYAHCISYGIIEISEDNTLSASDILSIADERMYEYKRTHKKKTAP